MTNAIALKPSNIFVCKFDTTNLKLVNSLH